MRGILALLVSAAPVAAEPFLALPIDCGPSDGCFIQNFMDRDPGPDYVDFTCGPLSYDGHGGTDFAVPTLKDMHRGVDVLAASDGTVSGQRDGMADSGLTDATADAIEGRECGNGVVIKHPQGWTTQYCHMALNSVAVVQGQSVRAGDVIGRVGQSGKAAFPHLHFAVRQNGERVDPFQSDATADCGTSQSALWLDDVPYTAGGIIGVALADRVPDFASVKDSGGGVELSARSPAMVVIGHAFGVRDGDEMVLTLAGPEGVIANNTVALTRMQARIFRASGRKARGLWPAGLYQGNVSLIRDGKTISAMTVQYDLH